jgi:hypothetical protein
MEKGDLSETEEVKPEPVIETIPAVKPKRKITLSEEERKRRGDNLRTIVAKRKAQNDQINQEVKEDVIAVKTQAIKKIKKIKKEKMLQVQYPDSDSDSDSSVELPSSKKNSKKKNKNPTIIIKNYTLPQREHKNEFDASEHIAKLRDIYREPEPVAQTRQTLGYFV